MVLQILCKGKGGTKNFGYSELKYHNTNFQSVFYLDRSLERVRALSSRIGADGPHFK